MPAIEPVSKGISFVGEAICCHLRISHDNLKTIDKHSRKKAKYRI